MDQTNGGGARRADELAVVLLAGAAGAVDALAFMALGHVFAGVMTGNLALLGIAAGGDRFADVVPPLVALAGFVAGTAAAARACRPRAGSETAGRDGGWPRRTLAALACEAGLLIAAAIGWAVGERPPEGAARDALLAVVAVAMGVQSGAMLGAGPVAAPSTYLTGSLTSFVTRGVGRLSTPGADAWVPARLSALAAGAGAAAALHRFAPAWAAALPPALVLAAAYLAGGRRLASDG